jgi:hypothetical protein
MDVDGCPFTSIHIHQSRGTLWAFRWFREYA